jgi:glycine cleavage system aminomethyltransferase T
LQTLSPNDLSNDGFPFGICRQIALGYQSALALRLTYVGELGWELYIPTAFALSVYDALIEAGHGFGLRHCGYHTLNSLRIEKAYRDWAHDIGPDDNPLQVGLAFTRLGQARWLYRARAAVQGEAARPHAASGAISPGGFRADAVSQ